VKVLVIGIGAGDPDHVTVQAVKAMATVDAFLVLSKGTEKDDLVAVRREVLARHVTRPHRILEGTDPERERVRDGYGEAVTDWRRRRADETERLLGQVAEDEVAAFLVWGDPALFDSTLAVLDELHERGRDLDVEVIPGITSVQALCAAHRIPLNRTGRPVQVTTGRRLAAGWPDGVDDLAVLLDSHGAYEGVRDAEVWWGAYVGTPDEVLVHGRLPEVAAEIRQAHAEARTRKGWIMDTYVLRRG
jgi:precorrin-6A synthase